MELFALIAVSLGVCWFFSDMRRSGVEVRKESRSTPRTETPPPLVVERGAEPAVVAPEPSSPQPEPPASEVEVPRPEPEPLPPPQVYFAVTRPKPKAPSPPPKLDKVPVLDAAQRGVLLYEQARAVLDNAGRYDFTADEIGMLRQYAEQKRPRLVVPTLAVHSLESWWSRER